MFLPAYPPFDLTAVARSHGWVQLPPFAETPDGVGLTYLDHLSSGRVTLLTLRPAAGGVAIHLEEGLTEAERQEAAAHVAWMLDVERDLTPFYQLAQAEPKLAHVVAGAHGRLLRSPGLFEDTVKTILTTNTTWSGTIRMTQALVQRFGAPWPADPNRRAFPTPATLAEADVDTLRTQVRLGYRAPYILELARALAEGTLDLETLKNPALSTADVRRRLLAIKGVGGYAAANLLLILGRSDFIPIDSYAYKLVSQEWYNGQPVKPAQIEAAFAHWGNWKGLAFWFWKWGV